MALLPKLRQLLRRKSPVSTVAARRPSNAAPHGDTPQEDVLRTILNEDPNDVRAFEALVQIVRHRASAQEGIDDPLTAASPDESVAEDTQRQGDLAVWALAEELAGHPKAWYPLVELARLSVADDHEGAVRRLATASEREPSGNALAEGLSVLRSAGLPVEALGLGVGHWRAREHSLEVGRQIVLAALESGRVFEARQHVESLGLAAQSKPAAVADLQAELGSLIDQAERAEA